MRSPTRLVLGVALATFMVSCSKFRPASPSEPSGAGGSGNIDSSTVPAWVTDPPLVPEGLRGQTNCTFGFGNPSLQWGFHPDNACWERPGPDGWIRQQQYRIHGTAVALCDGGPGDVYVIRVCREGGAGQPTPFCLGTKTTGPLGCSICVPAAECY
jgi:hypothetical protein